MAYVVPFHAALSGSQSRFTIKSFLQNGLAIQRNSSLISSTPVSLGYEAAAMYYSKRFIYSCGHEFTCMIKSKNRKTPSSNQESDAGCGQISSSPCCSVKLGDVCKKCVRLNEVIGFLKGEFLEAITTLDKV